MKSDYLERRIRLNGHTTRIIKSQKVKGSDIFKNTITVVYESAGLDPLQFATREELEQAIKSIDLEDEQVPLFKAGITIGGGS